MVGIHAVGALIGVLALAGCSAGAHEPAPTVTVTVTETAEPVAPAPTTRTAQSPVDGFDAFYFCRSEVLAYAVANPTEDTLLNDYDDSLVSGSDGEFTVQLKGAMGDRSMGAAFCAVSGTVGAPVLTDHQFLP